MSMRNDNLGPDFMMDSMKTRLENEILNESSKSVVNAKEELYQRIFNLNHSALSITTEDDGRREYEKKLPAMNDEALHLICSNCSPSYLKGHDTKETIRLLYLLDSFLTFIRNDKDTDIHKYYNGLYESSYVKITEYTNGILEPVRIPLSKLTTPTLYKITKDTTRTRNYAKFVITFIHSILELDNRTYFNIICMNKLPDWLLNFEYSKDYGWSRRDDDTKTEDDNNFIEYMKKICFFVTNPPDYYDGTGRHKFLEDVQSICNNTDTIHYAIMVFAYIEALISYASSLFFNNKHEVLEKFWYYPDFIVKYCYGTKMYVRMDEIIYNNPSFIDDLDTLALIPFTEIMERAKVANAKKDTNNIVPLYNFPTPPPPFYTIPPAPQSMSIFERLVKVEKDVQDIKEQIAKLAKE